MVSTSPEIQLTISQLHHCCDLSSLNLPNLSSFLNRSTSSKLCLNFPIIPSTVVRRKTIYEYHRVNFNRQDIKNWTVIYLNALPTCLQMDNCKDCLTELKKFDCKWCSQLNQCSTGTFRSRQDWLLKGCDVKKIKDVDNCPASTTMYKEQEEEFNHVLHVHSEETVTVSEMNAKQERPGTSPLERCKIHRMFYCESFRETKWRVYS